MEEKEPETRASGQVEEDHLRVDKHVNTLQFPLTSRLSLTLCGQLMSLKASPWHLSAENRMEPLVRAVAEEKHYIGV